MNWSGAWLGRWLGEWLGSSDDDGSIHAASAQALSDVVGASSGAMFVVGASTRELDATTGPASAAIAIAGTSSATLGATTAPIAVAPPKPFVPSTVGWLVGRRPVRAIAGRSAGTLDDVTGEATGKVSALTPRQLRGRRDDADLLLASGWR